MTPVLPATGGSSFSMNTATSFIAFSFIPLKNDTLLSVHAYLVRVGNPSDVRVAIYADSGGTPTGSALAESSGTDITATGYWTFALNYSVTAGTQYWVALKNYSSTPASNYVVVNYVLVPFTNVAEFSNHASYGYRRSQTTSGEGAWLASSQNGFGLQFNMASGLKLGGALRNGYASLNTAGLSNILIGNRFISPKVTICVDAISLLWFKVGSPASDCVAKLFINGSLVANSLPINGVSFTTTNGILSFVFPDPVAIPPESNVIVAVSNGVTDTSNYYRIGLTYFDPNERDIFPYSVQGVQSADGGSTWTDVTGTVYTINLGLQAGCLGLPEPVNRRTSTGR